MLQLLTFLVEKLSLLSRFKLFESSWADTDDQEARERHPQHRGPLPPLRRGDLLEVPRTIFTHYGIYLGDSKVAHLIPDILPVITNDTKLISSVITNKRLILGCMCKCATVRVDTLEDFAYGSKILVNRMDKMMKNTAFSNEDVAKRAEKLIGAIPYSLLWNNCEHFVTYCRYGAAASRQTEKFCECIKLIIRDQRSVIATVLLGIVSIVCYGMAPSTTLPTILIPFTLWMAG
ncbi:lecithin retinol acyltransferase a [Symphorus nematophorus]